MGMLDGDFRTVIVDGRELKMRRLTLADIKAFCARFRDQPLRDFYALVKAQGMPQDVYLAFVAEHYRHLPGEAEIVANHGDTLAGRAYQIYLMLKDNAGVSEAVVEGFDPETMGQIQTIMAEWHASGAEKKTTE